MNLGAKVYNLATQCAIDAYSEGHEGDEPREEDVKAFEAFGEGLRFDLSDKGRAIFVSIFAKGMATLKAGECPVCGMDTEGVPRDGSVCCYPR